MRARIITVTREAKKKREVKKRVERGKGSSYEMCRWDKTKKESSRCGSNKSIRAKSSSATIIGSLTLSSLVTPRARIYTRTSRAGIKLSLLKINLHTALVHDADYHQQLFVGSEVPAARENEARDQPREGHRKRWETIVALRKMAAAFALI